MLQMCSMAAVRGSIAMCCLLGVELIRNGFSAGDERLKNVPCFLNKKASACLPDFVGSFHDVGGFVFAWLFLGCARHSGDPADQRIGGAARGRRQILATLCESPSI